MPTENRKVGGSTPPLATLSDLPLPQAMTCFWRSWRLRESDRRRPSRTRTRRVMGHVGGTNRSRRFDTLVAGPSGLASWNRPERGGSALHSEQRDRRSPPGPPVWRAAGRMRSMSSTRRARPATQRRRLSVKEKPDAVRSGRRPGQRRRVMLATIIFRSRVTHALFARRLRRRGVAPTRVIGVVGATSEDADCRG
jgi:hypothetical protein